MICSVINYRSMNKKSYMFDLVYGIVCFVFGWLLVTTLSGQGSKGVFDPDVELRIPGLVCSSSAIGVKNGFSKTKLVKNIKFDTKKQICQIEFISVQIHPSNMTNIVKKAGYELKSIKWLKDRKPNRYNAP